MNSSAEVENHEDRQVTFRRYQVKRKNIFSESRIGRQTNDVLFKWIEQMIDGRAVVRGQTWCLSFTIK
jgi:hypothetical protein